jgi:putative Mn2+ efflux pump MntP
MNIFAMLASAVLLASAVSLDALATGFAYASNKTKVPVTHVLVISIIGSLLLGIALLAGFYIAKVIPSVITLWFSFAILAVMGLLKIAGYIKNKLKKQTLSSHKISWRETFVLAVGLSLDGMAVGVAAAAAWVDVVFCLTVICVSFVASASLFSLGQRLGGAVVSRSKLDFGWLGGLVLICLAVARVVI